GKDCVSSVKIDPWASATFNYTVKVTHDSGVDSGWQVKGTIKVKNPNTWEDIKGVKVTDSIDNGGSCTVDKSAGGDDPASATIPMSGEVDFPYTCTYSSAPSPADGTNTGKAEWTAATYYTPNGSATGTADADFSKATPTYKDTCFTVTDKFNGGS